MNCNVYAPSKNTADPTFVHLGVNYSRKCSLLQQVLSYKYQYQYKVQLRLLERSRLTVDAGTDRDMSTGRHLHTCTERKHQMIEVRVMSYRLDGLHVTCPV